MIHSAVGGITESDVLAGRRRRGAVIIGFHVIADEQGPRRWPSSKGVEIRTYRVIYEIIDDLKKAAEGMLAPEIREKLHGHAEVRQVFKVTKVGNIAGCFVTDGVVRARRAHPRHARRHRHREDRSSRRSGASRTT